MSEKCKRALAAALSAALAAALLTGCGNKKAAETQAPVSAPSETQSVSPSPSASAAPQTTKAEIEAKLETDRANLLDVTWAPDNSAVVYLRSGGSGATICLWRVGKLNEQTVRKVEGTLDGLVWSPDAACFLIVSGHTGSADSTSSIIDVKTLKQLGGDVASAGVSAPVWSPDGKYLALSVDTKTDDGKTTASLAVYALASQSSVTVATQEGAQGSFIVEYWKGETVGYTTLTASGERAEQTVNIGE